MCIAIYTLACHKIRVLNWPCLVHTSVCMVHIYKYINLCTCLFMYLFVYFFIYLSIYLFINLSIYSFIHVFMCLFFYLFIYLFIYTKYKSTSPGTSQLLRFKKINVSDVQVIIQMHSTLSLPQMKNLGIMPGSQQKSSWFRKRKKTLHGRWWVWFQISLYLENIVYHVFKAIVAGF